MHTPTVLFTWELGGGYGHVAAMAPIAAALRKRGLRVVSAIRDLTKRAAFDADTDHAVVQCPIQLRRPAVHEPTPATFAQLLANIGWGSDEQLWGLASGWRDLYQFIQPDAIVFEHSPTAILAARGLSIPQFSIGTGFVQPPRESPLPVMAPWREDPHGSLESFEQSLIARANGVLERLPGRSINSLAALFADLNANFLNTFPELDHYPGRQGGLYTGPLERPLTTVRNLASEAEPVRWPEGTGPKIFAYLKPMSALPTLVRWLAGSGYPTILVVDQVDLAELRPLASSTITLLDRPIPLHEIRPECDIAILNANHTSTAEFLLAGKPLLQIPLNLEQAILANRTVELGVALRAAPHVGAQVVSQLKALLTGNRFRHQAQQFADRHVSTSQSPPAEQIAQQIADAVG